MSFATDYFTAYKLLRTGTPDTRLTNILRSLPRKEVLSASHLQVELKRVFGYHTISDFGKALVPVARLAAIVYAFRIAREMRRQRILVRGLFDIKEEPPVKVIHHKDITLFPITVNRTTVQMVEREDVK